MTALQHAEQTAEWMRLVGEEVAPPEQKDEENKMVQVAPFSKVGAGRGNTGGIREAARQLGITRDDARRAAKVASLTPEAKAAAIATGLDNNQQELLYIAAISQESALVK